MKEKSIGTLGMAAQNLRYRTFRTGAMLFFVFLLSACLFVSSTLLQSMEQEIDKAVSRMGADIIVSPDAYGDEMRNAMFEGTPCTIYFERSWVDAVKQIEGVQTVSPQLYIATMQESPCCDMPSQLIAFDPSSDFIVKPWLEQFNMDSLGLGEVIIGSGFLTEVGETLRFYDTPFTVAAKMEYTGLSYDSSIFLSFDSVEQLMETEAAKSYLQFKSPDDLVSMILVDVAEGHDIADVKREMDYQYHGQGIEVTTANSLVSNAAQDVSRYTAYSLVLSGLLFLVVTLALFMIFSITVNERKREFGILYTMGATKGQMTGMLCLEGLYISLFGGLLGVGLSWGAMALFRNLIRLKAGLPALALDLGSVGLTALICLGLSLVAGLVASSYGAFAVARHEPYTLTRENE